MVYPEINWRSGVPLYLQLKRSFRRMAVLGLIQADEQLPPVRQLAAELGINPNTVHKAYRELEQEAWTYTVPGKGIYWAGSADGKQAEKEEIRRHFRLAAQVAWVAGLSSDSLHRLLDESLDEHKTKAEIEGQA